MRIELFTLCDFATNENGKLTIVNTLDEIKVQKLPWRAYFGFAVKGNVVHEQPEDTNLTLQICAEGSENVAMFEASTPVPNKPGRFAAAGNIRGLIFENAGKYLFRISTNSGLCEDFYFNVTEANNEEKRNS